MRGFDGCGIDLDLAMRFPQELTRLLEEVVRRGLAVTSIHNHGTLGLARKHRRSCSAGWPRSGASILFDPLTPRDKPTTGRGGDRIARIAPRRIFEIHVIDVGWGLSVLVNGPNGTTVLMDASDMGKGTSYVVPYLRSIGT